MPAPNKPDRPNRRFAVALTAAAATTTVAIGVTAATLLGWFRPAEPPQTTAAPPAEPAVVYVPITPTSLPAPPSLVPTDTPSPRLAMDAPREHDHGDEREWEEREWEEDDD